ncbi:MAG: hypothetical protein K6F51_09530 [Acetatifactor sp.]|nr:hypothetical protein [Acetatifactor sp.]
MNRIDDPFMEAICEELNHIEGFQYEEIENLHHYPLHVARKVLRVLIEYACSVTNDWPMSLARKEAKKINKDWLKCHFLEVADLSIDYSDDWEYRRLLELAQLTVPQLIPDIVERGIHSSNEEVREAAQDFSEYVQTEAEAT